MQLDAGDLDLSRGDSSLQATTSAEVTVTGEAVVNNRKNKLISAYELEVTGTWSGKFPWLLPEPAVKELVATRSI